jgi:hypothetical protein
MAKMAGPSLDDMPSEVIQIVVDIVEHLRPLVALAGANRKTRRDVLSSLLVDRFAEENGKNHQQHQKGRHPALARFPDAERLITGLGLEGTPWPRIVRAHFPGGGPAACDALCARLAQRAAERNWFALESVASWHCAFRWKGCRMAFATRESARRHAAAACGFRPERCPMAGCRAELEAHRVHEHLLTRCAKWRCCPPGSACAAQGTLAWIRGSHRCAANDVGVNCDVCKCRACACCEAGAVGDECRCGCVDCARAAQDFVGGGGGTGEEHGQHPRQPQPRLLLAHVCATCRDREHVQRQRQEAERTQIVSPVRSPLWERSAAACEGCGAPLAVHCLRQRHERCWCSFPGCDRARCGREDRCPAALSVCQNQGCRRWACPEHTGEVCPSCGTLRTLPQLEALTESPLFFPFLP